MKLENFQTITSCNNNTIKAVCALRQNKIRNQEQAFIIEGSKLFYEGFLYNIPYSHLFFTEKWLTRANDKQLKAFEQCNTIRILVSEPVMEKLSGQKNSEEILCRALIQKPDMILPRSIVFLENVQDPGNVGTIIRTADAAGYEGIITTPGTADVHNEKVLRASMGSVFHLPVYEHVDAVETILNLKDKGYTIIGSALQGSEEAFQNIPKDIKPVLILGNESKGMSEALQKACDLLVRIPMQGKAESLNVSVAAGLLMYQISGLL